ncbi:hypothetical protein LEP1GSC202_0484 [Leptospira yanagawae serovar Saopaulo str. Sao Paulo = ATCC 700523]|uniref:Uncharacterized protein n=1 Tax=Leptospira yanagawae serovar Saopaulo str. Sao Paulo = ATCC 700523 TaxID=1249483 RepID=A0A5E8HG03_9LEPT|nr:hypothetical protein LEP1GSC202_0484 [Leptospira yanagawae serovar Saopaulo str. Sao Paulo = ATCC 700523]
MNIPRTRIDLPSNQIRFVAFGHFLSNHFGKFLRTFEVYQL